MGILIIADAPLAGTNYDTVRFYRSSTKTGTYSQIASQLITDLTYFDEAGTVTDWYKIAYYNTGTAVSSLYSDPMQGQSTTYTSVKKVQSYLQISSITDSTNPNIQAVADLINRAEDIIDRRTGHAWRIRQSGTVSSRSPSQEYEYYDCGFLYEYQTGIPVYLKHRKIQTLSAASGDVLEFWNGNTWEDWIANRIESRSGDFWIDYELGILYIKSMWYTRKPVSFRLKYRYGEVCVDCSVEDLTTKMVAKDILLGMDPRAMIVQEGSVTLSHRERINILKEEIDDLFQSLKEWQVPSRMM